MSKGTLPFSSTDYDKLKHDVFPTIRRRDQYGDIGDVNTVVAGPRGKRQTLGQAEIIAKETATLKELNNQFLMFDTNTTDYSSAIELINSFYRDEIGENEELTIYWNRWTNKEDKTLQMFVK